MITRCRLVEQLLGGGVVALQATPSLDFVAALFPSELSVVERAVDKRRAEFATARVLARKALALLGVPAASLEPRPDRSPRWPPGTVGTITHTSGFCVVAVARSTQLESIGVDVERPGPLSHELFPLICTVEERSWLHTQPELARGSLAKLVFSAKEAFYKCQYPLTQRFLDFQDVELAFDQESLSFRAASVPSELDRAPINDARGRYLITSELIVTAVRMEGGSG